MMPSRRLSLLPAFDSTRATASLALLLCVAAAAPGRPQSPCDLKLIEAEESYEAGRFEEIPELLKPCTKEARRRQARLYALLAKTYVVTDRLAEARQSVEELLRLDPDFEPDVVRDPARFLRLVSEVKRQAFTVQVASVSKTNESLREAPATVVVITAEMIERRGYMDIEAVFHDLPGFDISRITGQAYSNIYQRGLRSEFTDQILFLVDGVEENDLYTNIARISRQYPVSNIERIEVIYGPASTMYGANAFAGVINLITKSPEELAGGDKRLGVTAQLVAGPDNTRYVEANLAGQAENKALSWSLTARMFESDEMDLTRYADWNYDPADFESVPYQDLLRIDGAGVADFLAFLNANPTLDCRGQADCFYAVSDTSVVLTPEGVARAAALDQSAYLLGVEGVPVSFANPTDDWFLQGRLRISRLELGFQTWRREEGQIGSFTDFFADATGTGDVEANQLSHFYAKYSWSFSPSLSLNFFSRFKQHQWDEPSTFNFLVSYVNQNLGVPELTFGVPAIWLRFDLYASNSQLRNELSLVYEPSRKLNLVSGIELRNSSYQAALIGGPPNPSANGFPFLTLPGGNNFTARDVGIYSQLSYRLRENLKIVAGGRIDDNSESNFAGGFGTVFNPRLALVYSLPRFVFKTIYSEAFRAAPNNQRFVTTPIIQELPGLGLDPEKVKNIEASISWQPSSNLSSELVAYDARYSSIVQLNTGVPCNGSPFCSDPEGTTGQFQNTGSLRIRGIQARAELKYRNYNLWANYTFTNPRNSNPLFGEVDQLRIADIASHQVNLGVHATLWQNFTLNARFNYVGSRDRGSGTTVNASRFSKIDDYTVVHLTLGYKDVFRHTHLQLIVNNLFDEEYFHPGVRQSNNLAFADRLPQRGRSIFTRILFSF